MENELDFDFYLDFDFLIDEGQPSFEDSLEF